MNNTCKERIGNRDYVTFGADTEIPYGLLSTDSNNGVLYDWQVGKEWVEDKRRHTEFKLSVRAEMKAPGSHECHQKRIAVSILKAYLSRKIFNDLQLTGILASGRSHCKYGQMK